MTQDVAFVEEKALHARRRECVYLSLKNSATFVKTSAGFEGQLDDYADLNDNEMMDWHFDWADEGCSTVAMMAQLPPVKSKPVTFDGVIDFCGSL